MPEATAISCTQCGAGLNVFGGGRVRAHVCGYCGAELDVQDDYKVLRRFTDMTRPETPFEIGMEGEIAGVPVTVIGTIGRVERSGGRTWRWVEHQVFSPTHGYSWLTWEDNHVFFSRKIRRTPYPSYVANHVIENAENRPIVRLDGEKFVYYASGEAEIDFVEGEFNWVPALGQTSPYVTFLANGQMLDIVGGARETEYEISVLPDRGALLQSFGIDPANCPAPSRRHPLKPFERSSAALFARNFAFACALLCLVISLVLGSAGQKIGAAQTSASVPLEVEFEVTQDNPLVEFKTYTDVDNSWAWLEGEVLDADDQPVYEFERGVEYYHGYDDGNWTEGSRTESVRMRLPAGDYTLSLAMTEAEVDWRGGRPPKLIRVEIHEGVLTTLWTVLGTVLFLVLGCLFLVQRIVHSKLRFAGSDWDDD